MDIKKILFKTNIVDVEKALPDAIVFCSKDGKILWVNDKAAELFETSKMHLLTSNIADFIENVLELAENAGKQVISPGTASGEAVKTDLNILVGVKKGADLTDISAVELIFKATCVPATPIREDSYLKATLQALIPEGVTIDLSQFMNNEE